jgi:hypothetical protein
MLQRIRGQVGGAGLIVAIVALVAALAGGAYAASGGLTGKQKKEVKTIAKSFQGTGPAGAAGPAGAPGAAGAKGDQGSAGTAGKDGKSVIVTSVGIAQCGGRGGVVVEEESTPPGVEVCNGEEGSPWTAGGTLPPGSTETGIWSTTGSLQTITTEVEGVKEEVTVGDTGGVRAPFTFAIPLEAGVKATHVHYVTSEEITNKTSTICPAVNAGFPIGIPQGTPTNPKEPLPPPPGELCVYESASNNLTLTGIFQISGASKGANTPGGFVKFTFAGPGIGTASGTFAVTGCSPNLPEGDPNKCPA